MLIYKSTYLLNFRIYSNFETISFYTRDELNCKNEGWKRIYRIFSFSHFFSYFCAILFTSNTQSLALFTFSKRRIPLRSLEIQFNFTCTFVRRSADIITCTLHDLFEQLKSIVPSPFSLLASLCPIVSATDIKVQL